MGLKLERLGVENEASIFYLEPRYEEKISSVTTFETMDQATPENLQLDISVT